MTTPLSNQKHLFSIPDHISYINCAYMGPLLKSVEAIGLEQLKRKSQPWLISPDDFFSDVEILKTTFAKLINSRESQRIAIIPSVSYGIANEHILVVAEQFPSNIYTWQELAKQKKGTIKFVEPPKGLDNRGQHWNEAIIEAIDENTAAVAIGTLHWADGTLYDLKAIREVSRNVGALLIVDGSQSVGALPFDIEEVQADALIVAGYKWLLGPYGTTLAYYGPAFDNGQPIEESWMNRYNSENFQGLVEYEARYKPMANRYNVGETSKFIHVPMLIKSIEQLLNWGLKNIQDYCYGLTKEPLDKLKNIGCRFEASDYTGNHLVGIHLPKHIPIDQLKKAMADRQVKVSFRGEAMRIAPHVYNVGEDFERLLEGFAEVSKTI